MKLTWIAVRMASSAALMVGTGLPAAGAQSRPTLAPGQRVKIEVACSRLPGWSGCGAGNTTRTELGAIQGYVGDTLHFESDEGDVPFAIPSEAVVRAWVADGTRGHAGTGALLGFVAGGAIGALIASAAAKGDPDFAGIHYMIGVGGGGLLGAGIGAAVGAQFRSDRWTEAGLPDDAGDVALERPGVRLGLTIPF